MKASTAPSHAANSAGRRRRARRTALRRACRRPTRACGAARKRLALTAPPSCCSSISAPTSPRYGARLGGQRGHQRARERLAQVRRQRSRPRVLGVREAAGAVEQLLARGLGRGAHVGRRVLQALGERGLKGGDERRDLRPAYLTSAHDVAGRERGLLDELVLGIARGRAAGAA